MTAKKRYFSTLCRVVALSRSKAEAALTVDPNYSALRELILHHPGGWADEEALRKARDICAAVRGKTDDRRKLAVIETLVRDLYSESGHRKWDLTQTTGRDVLRLAILRELEP